MLEALKTVLLILSLFFLLSILFGLYQPVTVLWFLDRFNRRKVLFYYGRALLVTLLAWGLLAGLMSLAV